MCSALCPGPEWIMSFNPHLRLEQLKGLGWVTEDGLAASSGPGWVRAPSLGTASFCLVWPSAGLSTPGTPKHANQAAWLYLPEGSVSETADPQSGRQWDSSSSGSRSQNTSTPTSPPSPRPLCVGSSGSGALPLPSSSAPGLGAPICGGAWDEPSTGSGTFPSSYHVLDAGFNGM